MRTTDLLREAEELLAHRPGNEYGVATSTKLRSGSVFVAVARRGRGTVLVQIDAAEYDGLALAALLDRASATVAPQERQGRS